MAGVKGVNCFLVARYTVFGLFTICNAITCSVAVWNTTLVRFLQPWQVDIYLIFLGGFSLVSIFTLIFVELLCTDVVTTRVWFECAWVTLFWVMELAGGAALIAIGSDITCSHQAITYLNALCTSERVLLAFTWTCTIMLLIYLLALVFIAASQYHDIPEIWVSDVRNIRGTALRQYYSSASNSPLTARFKKRASVDLYAPQPVLPPPVQASYHYRGLSSEYRIEPFHPTFVGPEQMDLPHSSNLPEAIPLPRLVAPPIMPPLVKPTPSWPKDADNMRSLLSGQFDPPRPGVGSSIVYSSSAGLRSGPVPDPNKSLPSPPPLGDWPRQDVMRLPAKSKRKLLPPSAFEFPQQHVVTDRTSVPVDTTAQPRPRRPSGPRLRMPSVDSVHRPAPLDLSGISNYQTEHLC